MKPVVFITGNANQRVGAMVAQFLLQTKAADPDAFEVRLLFLEDVPHLFRREGQRYRRKGHEATWWNDDLQSFTPLRFLPPQLMGYEGRALVIDPDVFARVDPTELLNRDMEGKSILCRRVERPGKPSYLNSAVMLLDCAKLTAWNWNDAIDAMFAGRWDYGEWVKLRFEDPQTLGPLEERWNQLDQLTPTTAFLHTTERSTQPWKTGLPVDFDTTWRLPRRGRLLERTGRLIAQPRRFLTKPGRLLLEAKRFFGPRPRYRPHPDPHVEPFFFNALAGCLDAGLLSAHELTQAIAEQHVRRDAPELVERYREWAPPAAWSVGD